VSENENELVSLRALVVDDSRVMRNMVMQTLNQSEIANFEYTEAGSGQEAMGQFDADKTDIIFVDWNMPGMNGIEFAREVRAMQWANHIPIVMITSETGSEKMQNAYDKARITCYVTKPFTVDEIREKVGPVIAELQKKREKSAAPPVKPAAPAPAKQGGGFFSKLLS
jgi:two-component system chemotaxis response regulator CheY